MHILTVYGTLSVVWWTLLVKYRNWLICLNVDEEFRVLVIPGHTKVPVKKTEPKRVRRQVSFLVCLFNAV